MRYPARETAEKHARILVEALRLFRERGFADVTVGEVMKATGLTHGPFYNHFASKDALIAECVEKGLCTGELASLASLPSSAEGKKAFVEGYLSPGHRAAGAGGCAFAALASEVQKVPPARGPFTTQLKATITKLVSHFPWRSKRTARAEAIRTMASLVGGLILARAVDDDAFAEEILNEVRRGLLAKTLPQA